MRTLRRSRARLRRGTTLIELTLAITLLSIGVLALVGSSGVMTAGGDDAWRAEVGARAARTRLETLLLGGCAAAVAGDSTVAPGVSVRWSASDLGGRRLLEVTATVITRSDPVIVRVLGATACAP